MKRVVVGLLSVVVLVFVVSGLAPGAVKALGYGGTANLASQDAPPAPSPDTLQPMVEVPAYLPLLTSNYCPDFYDDFSNPGSGWEIGEDDYVRTEYLDGEYRLLTKEAEYIYLYPAPSCARSNYVVEVDARWVGQPGFSYGIFFGLVGDYEQFYFVEINTDYSMVWVFRYGSDDFVELLHAGTTAINQGGASNHITVTRDGEAIRVRVNDAPIYDWYDATILGLTGYGVLSSPYDDVPTSDARFDNFAVRNIETEGNGSGQGPDRQSVLSARPFRLDGSSIGLALEQLSPPEDLSQRRE